ncbi:MAG: hypothetical protein KF688_18065 [Pirellulales bacterium]|nr:hypothetical protein [Pirellulales bacterium]
MPTYYCHKCGLSEGHVKPDVHANLTGEQYQLEKFIKHTAPTGQYKVNSIFADPSYKKYADYIVTTTASGYVEIDDNQRTNIVWFASEKAGTKYVKGAFKCDQSGVKVVFHDDSTKIHAFAAEVNFGTKTCAKCGASIPY